VRFGRSNGALVGGAGVFGLVATCAAVAWRAASPVVPRHSGLLDGRHAWLFLLLLASAFVAYLAGLWLLRGSGPRLALVAAVAVAVQLAPLGAPLLLSTDAWTYWDYGRLAAAHQSNPYTVRPSAFPDDPAFAHMGAAWREKTSVYGPAFTLASEPIARAAGNSPNAAAWIYKTLAALAVLAAAALVAKIASRRRALALAFVGWNPLLAIHFAGGGHNDAWVGALILAALALSAGPRRRYAGGVWALAIAIKWVPVVFLLLSLLADRRERRRPVAAGVVASGAGIAAVATWRYGWHWLGAAAPLARNAWLETSYALPHRLQGLGLPRSAAVGLAVVALAAGLVWLGRQALAGRVRNALAACLILATSPYLAVWYLGWVVPLAAADEDDRTARIVALGLCAYLLPQTIPH
jgi:alpha-1,6-mannosyltransferase